jgi:hypothetical protein
MRWECPFGAQRRHQCRLFDGPCEPGSEACFLADAASGLDDGQGEDLDRPPSRIRTSSWPTESVEPTRRAPFVRRTVGRARAE